MEIVAGRWVWIDLEMTGLNPQRDRILEIATLITDSELNEIAIGPNLAINQSNTLLAEMDEWNQTHHGASGLIERVRQSNQTEASAERITLDFIRQHVGEKQSPLCGNSVWQDRRFLQQYMPTLEGYFHYRNLDVSTVKELARNWIPALFQKFQKENAHLALADIRESVRELKYYKDHFFKLPSTKDL